MLSVRGTPIRSPQAMPKSVYSFCSSSESRRMRPRRTQTTRSSSPRKSHVPRGMSQIASTPTPWIRESPMRA